MAQTGPSPNSDVSSVDGAVDFSGGVNSLKVTTIVSDQNPNGLARNELAWLTNGTVRDGGITPRAGWNPIKQIGNGSGAYQGGFLYQPIDGSDPYFVFLIGGQVYRCNVDDQGIINLTDLAFNIGSVTGPSITIKNLNLPAGATIPVDPVLQSFYGLPASFVAPAINATIKIPTNGNSQTIPQAVVPFFGDFTIVNSTAPSVSTTPSGIGGINPPYWKVTLTLQNNSCLPGVSVAISAQVNPFVNLNGTNFATPLLWYNLPFVSPAIGGTVNVDFYFAISGIGRNSYLFKTNGGQIVNLSFLTPGLGATEVLSYDAGTNTIISHIGGNYFPINGNTCGLPSAPATATTIPGQALDFSCAQVPDWVFDSFTVFANIGNADIFTAVGRRPAVVPSSVPLVGTHLYFLFGIARVLNVTNANYRNFGTNRPFFCQGNEFLVIQAGDYSTLPLFWDGAVLSQSTGITDPAVAPGTPGVNEIPAGGPMDFYMGRLWYSVGSNFQAGDITGGASGTIAYGFRDAILNVTENPLVLGGDGFATPANEGRITALKHNANQDQALGQGVLFAFTSKGAHGLTVPVTRTDWIAANSTNQPKLVPVQLAMGTLSDRSVVAVNGDLFYQDPLGNIRTLLTAVRYFGQWGNLPISSNINRLLQFNDKALLKWGCGIYFNNRMIQSALPILTSQGTIHQALSSIDFEPISNFETQTSPIWEGMYEGLDILETFSGVFSGKERAFAAVVSRTDSSIQLWELTADERFDNTDNRIQMQAEMPAYTWGNEFSLKQQISAELWIDRLYGEVVFLLEYRPDGESCWQKWHEWKVCSPRNSCESTGVNPCTGLQQVQCYPLIPYGESYQQTMTLPTPPEACSSASGRPSYINYQCQPRLTVKGFCRIRGLLLHATFKDKALYEGKVC